MIRELRGDLLPTGWARARFGDVVAVRKGKKPPRVVDEPVEGTVPYVDIRAFERGEVTKFATPERAVPIEEGTILLVWDGARSGLSGQSRTRGLLGSTLARVDPILIDKAYVLHFLQKSYPELNTKTRGTGIPHVNPEVFYGLPLLVAPELEQHRIVEVIESYLTRLDDVVALLERVQRNLNRYRASVLKAGVEGRLVPTEAKLARKEGRSYESACELLERILAERKKRWIEDAPEKARAKAEEKARRAGKPWTHADNVKTLEKERTKAAKKYKEPAAPDTSSLPDLPEGWYWATVDQVALQVVDCLHSTPHFVGTGRACLDTNSMSLDGVVLEKLRFVDEETFQDRNRRMEPLKDDVVFAREGTVGTAVCLRDVPRVCLGQRVMIIRPGVALSGEYLANALMSMVVRRQYEANIAGSTVAHINMADIRRFAIPVPPLQEQERIVAQLARVAVLVRSSCYSSVRGSRMCHRLCQSILKWAFEGKLVDQDPKDEPASVLLERIKEEREAMQPQKKRRSGRRKKTASVKHDEQLDLLGGSTT